MGRFGFGHVAFCRCTGRLNPAQSSQSKFQETIVPRVLLVPHVPLCHLQSAKHKGLWEGQRPRCPIRRCPFHLFTPHPLLPAHLHRVRLRGGVRVAAGVVGGLAGLRDHGDAGNAEGIHAHRLRLVAWREA